MRTQCSMRAEVLARIEAAALSCGRRAEEVQLIAVSKRQPEERIESMLVSGQRIFGESRVLEAQNRWRCLRRRFSGVELHMVGSLQTNKAYEAVELFEVIHSLDRLKLAHALARAGEKLGKCPRVFVQVNTGEELQKSGIPPVEADMFISQVRDLGLDVAGLMVLPPREEAAAVHFAFLWEIAKRNGLGCLSMGMSADFETAIRFGATHVRVGSALFGERQQASGV